MIESMLLSWTVGAALAATPPLPAKTVGAVASERDRELTLRYRDAERFKDASVSTRALPEGSFVAVSLKDLRPPKRPCTNCLARVVWAVSTTGRPYNLGTLDASEDAKGRFRVPLREFAVLVTEEPHFAVASPCGDPLLLAGGDLERPRQIIPVARAFGRDALCPSRLKTPEADPWVPEMLTQARNARNMARADGVERSSPEAFERADRFLVEAERLKTGGDAKRLHDLSVRAVLAFADARRDAPDSLGRLIAWERDALRDAPGPAREAPLGRVAEFFEPGETALSASSAVRILNFVDGLPPESGVRFEITGHADAEGSPRANRETAAARAESVRRLLEEAGVPPARLRVLSRDDAEPAATNDTPSGRQLNRRVEIRAIGEIR